MGFAIYRHIIVVCMVQSING